MLLQDMAKYTSVAKPDDWLADYSATVDIVSSKN
jgi:hypothetical protein